MRPGPIEAFNINLLQFKGSLFATRPTLNTYAAKRRTCSPSPTICSRWSAAAR